MVSTKRAVICTVLFLALLFPSLSVYGENPGGKVYKDTPAEQAKVYPPLPETGKKISLGSNHFLVYGFDKKPKIGVLIMKVEIFNKEGVKDTSFEVKADAGMPSMRGAHETGEKSFTISKKSDYLLPIHIVMPGDWEIRLTVMKDGKVVMKGRYNFNV